jgi:hypothetical protein
MLALHRAKAPGPVESAKRNAHTRKNRIAVMALRSVHALQNPDPPRMQVTSARMNLITLASNAYHFAETQWTFVASDSVLLRLVPM